MPKKTLKGLTLIELLVVVAIIGILSGIGVVVYGNYTTAAKNTAIKSNHQKILEIIKASDPCGILPRVDPLLIFPSFLENSFMKSSKSINILL